LHLFAYDTHVHGRCSTSEIGDLAACTDEILIGMQSNRLRPTVDKTELIRCSTSRRRQQLQTTSIRAVSEIIPCTFIFCPQSRRLHRCRSVDADSRSTDALWLLCRSSSDSWRSLVAAVYCVMQSLVVSLVFSRLGNGNATLAGIPQHLLSRLQSVQIVLNAAARLIIGLPRWAHISASLAS